MPTNHGSTIREFELVRLSEWFHHNRPRLILDLINGLPVSDELRAEVVECVETHEHDPRNPKLQFLEKALEALAAEFANVRQMLQYSHCRAQSDAA